MRSRDHGLARDVKFLHTVSGSCSVRRRSYLFFYSLLRYPPLPLAIMLEELSSTVVFNGFTLSARAPLCRCFVFVFLVRASSPNNPCNIGLTLIPRQRSSSKMSCP